VQFGLIAIEDEGLRYDIASWGRVGEQHHVDGSGHVCVAMLQHLFCARKSSGYWGVHTKVFASLS